MAYQHQTVSRRKQCSEPDALRGRLPEAGFVRQSQLIPAILPFSGTTLWRKVKDGTFPTPVKLSARVTAWCAEDVREYLRDPVGYRAEVRQ